jgi:hypothetical protein
MSEAYRLLQGLRRRHSESRSSELASLLELLDDEKLRIEVLAACLELCTDGALQGEDFEPHLSKLLGLWADVFERAKSMQGSADKMEWKIDPDYSQIRHSAGLMLDLTGNLPIQQVENALRDGLSLTDQRLKMFAALSLLRQLRTVDPAELENIAASHETRIVFLEQLRTMKMEWLMPEAWSSPEMPAASELSRWIAHPMELGTPPEEIELMESFPSKAHGGRVDIYLFRFREFPKPWEPDQGWKAGIAGPFENGESIGSPWSRFESWDSKTPEEHFLELHSDIA